MKRLLPWLVLAAGFFALTLRYPSFPASWPIHWNAAGAVDGWTQKSYTAAAFPLVMAAGLTVLLELLRMVAGKARNRALAEPWGERLATANQGYLCYIATVLNLFLAYLACTLPLGPPPLASVFLLISATILYPAWDFARLARQMRAQGALPAGYRGALYNDANDPRLWVPKLMGSGYTLNFAHPGARWMMAALVFLPLVLSLVVVRLVAHP